MEADGQEVMEAVAEHLHRATSLTRWVLSSAICRDMRSLEGKPTCTASRPNATIAFPLKGKIYFMTIKVMVTCMSSDNIN